MKNISIAAAIAAAVAISTTNVSAQEMEKCKVVDKDGRGLIKAAKADCAGGGHSCAGQNKAGDPESWIMVPKGQCEQINAGDFSGVSQAIRDKIDGAK